MFRLLLTTLSLISFISMQAFAENDKIKVAIVDSGVDFSHEVLFTKQFNNPEENVNGKDDDKNSYIDDINGWNLAENNNKVIDIEFFKKNEKTYNTVKRALILLSKAELGEPLTKWETLELYYLALTQLNTINLYGTLIHGTHVAGIASKDNEKAEFLGVKMAFGGESNDKPVYGIPKKEVLEKFINEALKSELEFFKTLNRFLKTQDIRVINASWGANEALAQGMFKVKFPELPAETYPQLAKEYMKRAEKVYSVLPEASPDSLWVIAAGNDGANNDEIIDWPANLRYPNTISIAAVDSKNQLASFSNFGAEMVDVAAPGVQINSSIPLNSYTRMSGTSMAAPFVTNVASKIAAANPSLKPADIKKILMETSDKKSYLFNKIKSSGIVNSARSIVAAEATIENSVEEAITLSFEKVPAVKELKSKGPFVAKAFGEMLTGVTAEQKKVIEKLYQTILHLN